MMDENELLFDKLYEQTQECGRTQFIRLLMDKERHIKQLQSQLQKKEKIIEDAIEYVNGWLSFPPINCNEIKELQNILSILERK